MFERFTDRAREVVVLAQEEARSLRHGSIGTEHLLLGLLREEGRAATTLRTHGVAVQPVRVWVDENVGRGPDDPPAGQLPVTPRVKKIFELSVEDAERLGHRAVGTQHLLIALLHEGQGSALGALRDLGAAPEDVWITAFRQLGVAAPPYVPAGLPSAAAPRGRLQVVLRVPPVAAAAVAAAGSFVVGLVVGWLIWG